jgi:DNA-binding LytR/AlgR family response regulator
LHTKTIRYVNVDDNNFDRDAVKTLALAYPALLQAGQCSGPVEAMEMIKSLSPDLIFLDIEMPDANGIELLKNVRRLVPMAVFITSHPSYAIDGFELNALDYILKPCTAERFAACMKRVEEYWEMKQKALLYEVHFEKDIITIKEGYNQVNIPAQEIIYCEAMQDYTKIVTASKNYLTLATLSDFIRHLNTELFIRVHRSYAVNIKKVNAYAPGKLMMENIEIPIGKTYRSHINRSTFT